MRTLSIVLMLLAGCRTQPLSPHDGGASTDFAIVDFDVSFIDNGCAGVERGCAGITCGPRERCDVSGPIPACICGSVAYFITTDAIGCECDGSDPSFPGCGNSPAQTAENAVCFPPQEDLAASRQCVNQGMTTMPCGSSFGCPIGAWCDESGAEPVCRCGETEVNVGPGCICDGGPDPDHPGCRLGPFAGCA